MDPETVKAMLLPHEPELKNDGIARLFIFGSVARGEATADSDVDLLTEFDMNKHLTAFDKAGLEVRISEILHARVELCERRLLKDDVRSRAAREAVVVF
jgi:predicted nucleotidyltransferase